jgi:putative transferase (TIGR04331 family)
MSDFLGNYQSRYLVLTAEESTWKFDRPILFLGEWCRRFSRKSIWEGMDAIVAKPYGLLPEIRDRDFYLARKCEEFLFPYLCATLNTQHGVNHSQRYWRILVGHWFRRFIEVALNRHNTLASCIQNYHINGVTIYSEDYRALVSQNSSDAIQLFNDQYWNSLLFAEQIKYVGKTSINIEILSRPKKNKFLLASQHFCKKIPFFSLRKLVGIFKRAGLYLSGDRDGLIIGSYLPFWDEILLQLRLFQFPQRLTGTSKNQLPVFVDLALRDHLTEKFTKAIGKLESDFFKMAMDLTFRLLPACYLEGYSNLQKKADCLPWPENPSFIFTSNNFDTDEVFKIWTASKSEVGSSYIVGQHGNNYGTSRYMNPSIEELTADKFITWGWVGELSQHAPGFILKSLPTKACNSMGGLLLVELHAAQMLNTWDAVAEFAEYFQDQFDFVSLLKLDIKERLTVRLHPGYESLDWGEIDRWKIYDSEINLEHGKKSMNKMISENRMVVFSYDSTGFLETLAANIPTLAFWRNELNHIRESAKPHYQMLVDVGIIHLSVESIAKHINDVWGDVDKWWSDPDLQKVRRDFCANYARVSNSRIDDLTRFLKKDCKSYLK